MIINATDGHYVRIWHSRETGEYISASYRRRFINEWITWRISKRNVDIFKYSHLNFV